jgi:CRP-like cAMP-binding protein
MITSKTLKSTPFFEFLKPHQAKAIAQISEIGNCKNGEYIFREKERATGLYILVKGSVDLFFTVEVEYQPELRKEFPFSVINPGDVFGISALIEPHILTSSARASKPSQVIKIDMLGLLALCDQDEQLAYKLMHQIAKTTLGRLKDTQLQLATAWATPSI